MEARARAITGRMRRVFQKNLYMSILPARYIRYLCPALCIPMIQTRHNWNSQSLQTARETAFDIPPEHGGGWRGRRGKEDRLHRGLA